MTTNLAGIPIRLRGCSKTFADGTRALAPTDLEIAAGETIVLLGPSGCGKTTTLRIVAGLEEPDDGGQVLFEDADVTRVPIERRNVGMVFQSYALFPNMDVASNVEYGLRVRGMRSAERRQRVGEMLAMMRIEPLAHRRIDQLSGGQRQRVALARAIAPRPRVLLLDEPLTALDAKLREDLRLEIDRLLRSLGVTTVYVTHDQAEAMALGDRIAVMAQGRIAQIGTPQDIYFSPADAFVADFIGTMNRVSGVAADGRLRFANGWLPLSGSGAGPADAMFRPEDLRLVDPPQAQFSGRVVSAFFLGDHTRLVIDAGTEPMLTARVHQRQRLRAGDVVHCAVDGEAVLALRGADAGAAQVRPASSAASQTQPAATTDLRAPAPDGSARTTLPAAGTEP